MRVVIASLVSMAALSAQAAVLDFSGDVCSSFSDGTGAFVACGNGSYINQAYGDVDGVNVTYLNQASSSLSMQFWADAYSGLTRVAYGSVPVITIQAPAGASLSLGSFQLGAWPNLNRNSQVTVTEIGGATLLSTGPITILGSSPSTFEINAFSTKGFEITFGPDGFNVGIDNLTYTTARIPEPGTLALLGLGLAGLAAARRRKQ